jgi:hypothetical protein
MISDCFSLCLDYFPDHLPKLFAHCKFFPQYLVLLNVFGSTSSDKHGSFIDVVCLIEVTIISP